MLSSWGDPTPPISRSVCHVSAATKDRRLWRRSVSGGRWSPPVVAWCVAGQPNTPPGVLLMKIWDGSCGRSSSSSGGPCRGWRGGSGKEVHPGSCIMEVYPFNYRPVTSSSGLNYILDCTDNACLVCGWVGVYNCPGRVCIYVSFSGVCVYICVWMSPYAENRICAKICVFANANLHLCVCDCIHLCPCFSASVNISSSTMYAFLE